MKYNKLVTDSKPIDQPNGTYRKAYNILKNKAKGALTSEEGFSLLHDFGKHIRYILPIDKDEVVVFSIDSYDPSTPPAGDAPGCEIGILDAYGRYSLKLKDDSLKLGVNTEIDALWVRNFKKELYVLWVDGTDSDKILNLDNVPFDLTGAGALVNSEDSGLFDLSPQFSIPSINMTQVSDLGGAIKTGAYFFTSIYESEDRTESNPGVISGPISISAGTSTTEYAHYTGDVPDIVSGKAIQLEVTGVDQRYKYITMIVIKKIGGVVTAHSFLKKLIEDTSFIFSYSGGEFHEDLLLEDVISEPIIYDSSKTIAYNANQLYKANLTANKQKEYNYQAIANNIKIDWVTDEVNINQVEGSYKDPYTILTKRGFFPDEVYAMYVRLIYTSGVKSDAFHIPGPTAESRQSEVSLDASSITVLDSLQDVLDDPSITGYGTPFEDEAIGVKENFAHDVKVDSTIKFFQTRETAVDRSEDNMGVWYNENEKYPDDAASWGALAGTPVRHHKFPAMDVFCTAASPILQGGSGSKLVLGNPQEMSTRVWRARDGHDENNDFEKAFAIPLKVIEKDDACIQGTGFVRDGDWNGSWSAFDNLEVRTVKRPEGRHDTSFENMPGEYSPLFFYDKATEAKTIRVKYDLKFVLDLLDMSGWTNWVKWKDRGDGDFIFQVAIVQYNVIQGTDYYNPQPAIPPLAAPRPAEYVLWREGNPYPIRGQDQEASGTVDIPLDVGDSLILCVTVFSEENISDDIYESAFHWTQCDIEVTDSPAARADIPMTGKVLGIDVKNVVIPEEIAGDVLGYEILYAKRELSSSRVMGQSLLFGSAGHPLDYVKLGSHAGNSTMMSRTGSGSLDTMLPYLRDDKIRFHAFDLLKDKPQIEASFVKVGAQFRSRMTNQKTIFDQTYDPLTAEADGRLDQDSRVQSHYLCDMVNDRSRQLKSCDEFDRVRAVTAFKYIPPDVGVGYEGEYLDNSYSEECGIFTVDHSTTREVHETIDNAGVKNKWLPSNPNFFPNNNGSPKNFTIYPYIDADPTKENLERMSAATYFLGTLFAHKSDLYNSLFDQELASTGKIFRTAGASGAFTTGNLFGGDTFLSLYGLRLTAAIYGDNATYVSINSFEAAKNIFYFPCYSAANINLRSPGDTLSEDFYPNVGQDYNSYKDWVKRGADVDNSNYFKYNNDYTSLNDLQYSIPYNAKSEFLGAFPYRVARSDAYEPESKSLSFRRFKSNNYKEMPKNRGEIMNLDFSGGVALIHLKYGLFESVSKFTLETNHTEIALGTGDLFRLEPEEVMQTDLGYVGLQQTQASHLSKVGYISIDSEQGKIFLYKNRQVKDITEDENQNHFRDTFKLNIVNQIRSLVPLDEEFADAFLATLIIGYSIVYDAKWDRVIISKRDFKISQAYLDTESYGTITFADLEDNSHTVSFDGSDNSLISFHNYSPDVIASTRNHLFSYKDGEGYLHNAEGVPCKFYGGAILPSFIDVVFNVSQAKSKLFQSLQWITEVFDGDTPIYYDTFGKIMCYNDLQCSGYVDIVPKDGVTANPNARYIEGTWNTNDFRDIVADKDLPFMEDGEPITANLDGNMMWYNKKRFTGKYLITRFYYSNLSQKELYLYDLSASIIESHR